MNWRFTVNTWLRSVRELEISQNVRLKGLLLENVYRIHAPSKAPTGIMATLETDRKERASVRKPALNL